ncbi:DUF1801 domain-containing protein [Mariniflexile jejuense]|uniref:DUF1801 domain-containing protein n=1 Tax=Mariniflexile jejuense TaxID=1173582 RepID=A0ABW3JFH2_9FLAO
MNNKNNAVTIFLDALNHPFRTEIELLRQIILNSINGLSENIKWNGPNYYYDDADRITMKIHPPKHVQLIFHRGAKTLNQPKNKIINTDSSVIVWKENDRAVVTFKNLAEIEKGKTDLTDIVKKWIIATKNL